MIARLLLVAPLACAFAAPAFAGMKAPPPELAAFVAAVKKADAIDDPLQRCLAYPDLPGNTWAPGAAKARCVMFNQRPLFTLGEIEGILQGPGGAKTIDAKFRALLDAHFTDPNARDQTFTAYLPFADRGKLVWSEGVARKWLAASPDSPYANTAVGRVLVNKGWAARGGKWIQDTPRENLIAMSGYFEEAQAHLDKALEIEPRLLPACEALMQMGRQADDQVQVKATATCLAADPNSYNVVEEMMNNAEPRWGGSLREMREVARYASDHVKENPALAVMTTSHESYEFELEADEARAIPEIEPLALRVPNAGYLRTVGGAYLHKDDFWKAFVYLSEALRFMPDYGQESRWRAYVISELGDPQWARADAQRALKLEPEDPSASRMLADILRDTGHSAEARPLYEVAMREPKLRQNAYIEFCRVAVDRRGFLACTDALTTEFPDFGPGWYQRLSALGGYDAPGAENAMRRFLATYMRDWPLHVKRAQEIRAYMARHDIKE
ncbi:hypothetical protein LF41_802 [Lysobacter dokdonensis DS-58]|uniref:Uncharacterized protein n=1 Tax=Lysobacter dokdonensis DS-58 TaxID=1300345 RepID=A0A0A2WJB7_9GAMM|nr:DUF4034 domain-containing protein [Lysobacter dokdonensis]KGQ20266.1 hypothetical protein LF41_802 [Lysobacter dokdonensis DS-58]